MSEWQPRRVPLNFGVGDRVLFSHSLPLQVRGFRLGDGAEASESPQAPADPLMSGCEGYFIRALPVTGELPRFARMGGWLRYVTMQYSHCYIDLSVGMDGYRAKFSSKTRSTINRKLRRFKDHCGGELKWQIFERPDAMAEFHRLAREVSVKTYQERLLDAGIPDGGDFMHHLVTEAGKGNVRGYILFHAAHPVAYLYCPVKGNAFIYKHQGYLPEYMDLSVGTVLQWLALEDIFARPSVQYFDFTEGTSDHKRLFSTHEKTCANVMFVRPTWTNRLWLGLHALTQDSSSWLGRKAQDWGIRTKVKRLMRFGLHVSTNSGRT